MALTEQQKRFLDAYIRDHSILGKGKKKRADNFSAMRQQVMEAFSRAPSGLPNREELLRQMAAADQLGEELKFDRATEAMKQVLDNLRKAVDEYTPVVPVDPSQNQPGSPEKQLELTNRLKSIFNDRTPGMSWAQLSTDPKLGGDLRLLANGAGSLLMKPAPTVGDLAKAERLLSELSSKRDVIGRRNAEVAKRIRQLRKYAEELQQFDKSYRNPAEEKLATEALLLAGKPPSDWTEQDRTRATSLYLDMMLAIASRDNVPQKNFKEGVGDQIVLAVQNKSKEGGNFKLVVKPLSNEIPVEGFKEGGGASREMLGSVIGDKLQEMLGLDLNVPPTKLMKVDGGMIGLQQGEQVTASVQSFVKGGKTPKAEASERLRRELNRKPFDFEEANMAAQIIEERCGRAEIQSKAVFDLISLHTDRHEDNIMLGEDGNLIPIDHGNILPTREGMRMRASNIGPNSSILATTATANQKLDEEMLQKIDRLDVDELISSMKSAKQQMSEDTPDADVGDLDEAFGNVRRSSEFLKFAARHLTLKQIYQAYEVCQDEIFFSDEQDKLQSFQRAIDIITSDGSQLQEVNRKYALTTNEGLEKTTKRLAELNWFKFYCKESQIKDFIKKYPARLDEILEKPITGPDVVRPKDMPQKPENEDLAEWYYYWGLGGDDACRRYGHSLDQTLRTRIALLSYHMAILGRAP